MLLNSISIVELKTLPEKFKGQIKENNLLEYENFHILVATKIDQVVGSVRVGVRVENPAHGLITDLIVDKDFSGKGLEEQLLSNAEQKLTELGVKEVDGVCLDGLNHVRYFYRAGYKPFRRSVHITWDLTNGLQMSINPDFEIREFRSYTQDFAELIVNSLQPYWTPWKESADKKTQEVRIKNKLEELFEDRSYRIFSAYQSGKMVGLVDTQVTSPNLVFGVCVRRDFGGARLGSTLLQRALEHLQNQGLKTASTLATSGLDDYDPQIYLYALSAGGKMEKEYIDLRKDLEKETV